MRKDSMIKVFRVQSYRDSGKLVGDWIVVADDTHDALLKTRRHYPSHRDCILTAEKLDIVRDEELIEFYMKCGTFI